MPLLSRDCYIALKWRFSEIIHDLMSILPFPSSEDPKRPSSICRLCWDEIFGPNGWLARALTSPTYRNTLHQQCKFQRHRTTIISSSAAGCQWCKFIMSRQWSWSTRVRAKIEFVLRSGNDFPDLCVRPMFGSQRDPFLHFMYTEYDDDSALADLIPGRSEIYNPGSPRALSLAQKCIMNCIQNHDRCPSSPYDPLLPSRVIDCRDPQRPRLASLSPGVRGKYLALSYVWGEAQPHSTNTYNVSEYHEGITLSLLPQTIRDAIITTSAFGIEYLWVDSLCIIQDSAEDKARQLPQMGKIYYEAYFTIIAASARRASEGFLETRNPPPRPDPSFQLWCHQRQRLGTFRLARHYSGYNQSAAEHILSPDFDPTHTRGWCLQEWLLSSRALVYTSRTLQYHCQTTTENIDGSRWESQRFPAIPKRVHYLENNAEQILQAWQDVVEEFTRRAITIPSDKLVAFSGIAEEFYKLRGSRYYAGLWEDRLVLDLLWETKPENPAYPEKYRAPSWSWAALDSEIQYHDIVYNFKSTPENTVYCKVLSCDVCLVNETLPFGEVASGSLVLRAPMVQANVGTEWITEETGRRRELHFRVSGPGGNSEVPWDAPSFVSTPVDANKSLSSRNREFPSGTAIFDRRDQTGTADLHAVALKWGFAPSGGKLVDGLLLTPCSRGPAGEQLYRRVGRWVVFRNSRSKDTMLRDEFPAWISEFPDVLVTVL
ncbi:hypothetical protein HGRIS_014507 [Hohenbuehelia grisea]|uniref:Heterokaryon incompatibility domain-containing protein n=1 Tax=Hohenbuehelia grisea TaxID=104357 RepID=A0ABR3JVV8_9AGAR